MSNYILRVTDPKGKVTYYYEGKAIVSHASESGHYCITASITI